MTRSFLQPIKFDIRKRIAAPNGVNYDSLYRQNQNSNSLPLTAQMTVGELFMNIPTKLYTICIFCFCCYISSFSKAKILDLLSFCPKSMKLIYFNMAIIKDNPTEISCFIFANCVSVLSTLSWLIAN